MRADARRNRKRLLEVAGAAIEETGTDASLEDIARRAGVGIGTLYRHFPSRHALLEALLRDRFDGMRAEADRLATVEDPVEALLSWLRILASQSAAYRGLTATMMSALQDESSELYASCHTMNEAGKALLVRAQSSGAVRADVDASDVFGLAYGIAFTVERGADGPAGLETLLSLLMDGLRAR
ncbi:MAG TPA: helix-turn-helix domain-containing protein [Actinopolymorphaceae bacterium]